MAVPTLKKVPTGMFVEFFSILKNRMLQDIESGSGRRCERGRVPSDSSSGVRDGTNPFKYSSYLLTVPTNTVPTTFSSHKYSSYLLTVPTTYRILWYSYTGTYRYLFVIVIFFVFLIQGHNLFIWFSISTRKFQKYWAKNTFTVPSHTYLYIGTGILIRRNRLDIVTVC